MRILQLIKEAFFSGIDRLRAKHTDPVQMTKEEVDAFLAERVKAKGEALDVRNVVDLLKALDLDSSIDGRVELAKELDYVSAEKVGSAAWNIGLHALLMKDLYLHKFKGD